MSADNKSADIETRYYQKSINSFEGMDGIENNIRELLKGAKKSNTDKVVEYLRKVCFERSRFEKQNDNLLDVQGQLEVSLDRYTGLFDYSPVGYFILNETGKITEMSLTGAKQLGGEKTDFYDKPFSIFIQDHLGLDEYYRRKKLLQESGVSQRFESTIKNTDGTTFDALLELFKVKTDSKVNNEIHITVTNISDIKIHERVVEHALKKQIDLNEMKSRFISLASHEFRNPLASILASVYLLEKYNVSGDFEKREGHIVKIKNAVTGLNEILNDFISLNQMENAITKNNPVNFNIVTFIEKIIDDLKIDEARHRIVYIHNGEFQNVCIDKNLLKICLNNILGNAIKYSTKGGTIEIETTLHENPKTLVISVKDEGIGIPENEQDSIFQQFYRAKNAENIQGTGLGLDITKKLVGIIGGTIDFTSVVNKGTTFFITI